MVIDRATGKGCAWSIVSKTIAQKLISEGIIGKPLTRVPRKNRYDLVQVISQNGYCISVNSPTADRLAKEPLWAPSFMKPETWRQAVGRFRTHVSLEENVQEFILPEMGEYLQNIPDIDLVSMTKNFLIAHGVINTPISQRAGKTYYFNENEIYSLDEESKLFPYEGRIKFNMFTVKGERCFNMNVWSKSVSQFRIGTTLDECIGIFFKTELVHKEQNSQSPVDQLVQYIGPPIYERIPENQKESTFDRIRVSVGLPRYKFTSLKALRNEIKKYRREIYQQVVQKLEKDRQFKKYGVPINILKLSNVTFLHDFSMEFIFELKEPH
ncbi:MAG: hypothetical protein KHX28_04225 [Oscillospiraceae bacterium]|nr:hypothetical protein [Oscillospiraceae bacterium]